MVPHSMSQFEQYFECDINRDLPQSSMDRKYTQQIFRQYNGSLPCLDDPSTWDQPTAEHSCVHQHRVHINTVRVALEADDWCTIIKVQYKLNVFIYCIPMQEAEWNYMKPHNTSTKVTPKYAALMQHYAQQCPLCLQEQPTFLASPFFTQHWFSAHYDCRASIKVSDGNLEAVDGLLCQQWRGVKNEGTD